jgi:ribonuclease D
VVNHLYTYDLPAGLSLAGDLAIDTETLGLNLSRDRLCVVQISNGDGNAHLVHFPEPKYDAPNLRKLLRESKGTKIFHYARFDLAALKIYLDVELKNSVYCTKIASKLVRTYTDKHGLKDLCREFLNFELSKQQQSSYWGSDSLTEEQVKYAASDVLYLHELKAKLEAMLKDTGRTELAKACFTFLPARVALDMAGWQDHDIFSHA